MLPMCQVLYCTSALISRSLGKSLIRAHTLVCLAIHPFFHGLSCSNSSVYVCSISLKQFSTKSKYSIKILTILCAKQEICLLLTILYILFLFQEVVGTLVSHIGSGLDTEATAALEVLDTLVIAKLQDVQQFTLIIKVCMYARFICIDYYPIPCFRKPENCCIIHGYKPRLNSNILLNLKRMVQIFF